MNVNFYGRQVSMIAFMGRDKSLRECTKQRRLKLTAICNVLTRWDLYHTLSKGLRILSVFCKPTKSTKWRFELTFLRLKLLASREKARRKWVDIFIFVHCIYKLKLI